MAARDREMERNSNRQNGAGLTVNASVTTKRWVGISHPSRWDDKPCWSPDGRMLYFISDRDGYLCLWAQKLDPETKHPVGQPFAVYHLHSPRLALSNLDTDNLEIDVAKDKIVLGLGELTGDIWRARRR